MSYLNWSIFFFFIGWLVCLIGCLDLCWSFSLVRAWLFLLLLGGVSLFGGFSAWGCLTACWILLFFLLGWCRRSFRLHGSLRCAPTFYCCDLRNSFVDVILQCDDSLCNELTLRLEIEIHIFDLFMLLIFEFLLRHPSFLGHTLYRLNRLPYLCCDRRICGWLDGMCFFYVW